jgi:hypothetical protein
VRNRDGYADSSEGVFLGKVRIRSESDPPRKGTAARDSGGYLQKAPAQGPARATTARRSEVDGYLLKLFFAEDDAGGVVAAGG